MVTEIRKKELIKNIEKLEAYVQEELEMLEKPTILH